MTAPRTCLALLASALLAGCGTILQPSGKGPVPFGGVRWDVQAIMSQWDRGEGESTSKAVRRRCVVYPLLFLDVPLSLAADIVILPYTLFNQIGAWIDDESLPVNTPKGLRPPGPF